MTLEDALFSAKSMAIMFGSVDSDGDAIVDQTTTEAILRTVPKSKITNFTTGSFTFEERGSKFTVSTNVKYYDAEGKEATVSEENTGDFAYAKGELTAKSKYTINITADTFPGTYYCTGETYARSEITGEDELFQLVIPKAKVQSENTLSMEAEGDPSTFSMNLRVLRPTKGPMMKLIKYSLTAAE